MPPTTLNSEEPEMGSASRVLAPVKRAPARLHIDQQRFRLADLALSVGVPRSSWEHLGDLTTTISARRYPPANRTNQDGCTTISGKSKACSCSDRCVTNTTGSPT